MANTATNQTQLANVKCEGRWGGVTPVTISWDTVTTDSDVFAAVTGKMIGIVGGYLQNNHASGGQTVVFKSKGSGTATEIARKYLAGAGVGVWEFGDQVNGRFSKTPAIITQPGEKLQMRLNSATNQPIEGVLYIVTSKEFFVL